MPELVECLSSFTYADQPLALTYAGRRHKIVKILARWRTPGKIHFRVHTDLGAIFELRYHEAADEYPGEDPGHGWQIYPF